MKSILAVAAQMALSGSNYLVFVLMARLLPEGGFIAFSTAVGLNMLAYALAEGGVSYVAPRAISLADPQRAPRLAAAFMLISAVLYGVSLLVGWWIWNTLAQQPLSAPWVLAYTAFFAPALLMPAWITSLSMDLKGVVAVVVVRAAMVLLIAYWVDSLAFAAGGLAFLLLTLWLLRRSPTGQPPVRRPDRAAFRQAATELRQVFAARTASYTVYAALPMAVGIALGNAASAAYITAERLKSLYSTLFQPVLQSLYLWQFQRRPGTPGRHGLLVSGGVQALNLVVGTGAMLAGLHGMDFAGTRLAAAAANPGVWVAACASVASTALLMLHVFPTGRFELFRRGAMAQSAAFLLMGALLLARPGWPVISLLVVGEVLLLLVLSAQLAISMTRREAAPTPGA